MHSARGCESEGAVENIVTSSVSGTERWTDYHIRKEQSRTEGSALPCMVKSLASRCFPSSMHPYSPTHTRQCFSSSRTRCTHHYIRYTRCSSIRFKHMTIPLHSWMYLSEVSLPSTCAITIVHTVVTPALHSRMEKDVPKVFFLPQHFQSPLSF
jgi:hypothetical protein